MPKHAPVGAAWRASRKGASRCLEQGCDKSAPFFVPQHRRFAPTLSIKYDNQDARKVLLFENLHVDMRHYPRVPLNERAVSVADER